MDGAFCEELRDEVRTACAARCRASESAQLRQRSDDAEFAPTNARGGLPLLLSLARVWQAGRRLAWPLAWRAPLSPWKRRGDPKACTFRHHHSSRYPAHKDLVPRSH